MTMQQKKEMSVDNIHPSEIHLRVCSNSLRTVYSLYYMESSSKKIIPTPPRQRVVVLYCPVCHWKHVTGQPQAEKDNRNLIASMPMDASPM